MLAINISEVWPCIFGKYTNIIAAQIHLQCVSIKPSSQIKVTFSFQFQQVDPTRCLQKSPLFRFLQLWNSLQLLGLASPVHILKKWFPGPLRTIFITMVPFLISLNLFGPLKSVQSRSEGHPSDGAPLPNGFRPLPNPRHCKMLPLSTKSCLKSSKLRPILNGQFCHAISKNIGLNVLRSRQPSEILVFVILKL